jgi:hypothetical protein
MITSKLPIDRYRLNAYRSKDSLAKVQSDGR